MTKMPKYHPVSGTIILILLFFIYLTLGWFWFYNDKVGFFSDFNNYNLWIKVVLVFSLVIVTLMCIEYINGLFVKRYILTKEGISLGKLNINWKDTLKPLIIVSHPKGQDREPKIIPVSKLEKENFVSTSSYILISKVSFDKVRRAKWFEPKMTFASPTSEYFFVPYSRNRLDKIMYYRQQRVL